MVMSIWSRTIFLENTCWRLLQKEITLEHNAAVRYRPSTYELEYQGTGELRGCSHINQSELHQCSSWNQRDSGQCDSLQLSSAVSEVGKRWKHKRSALAFETTFFLSFLFS